MKSDQSLFFVFFHPELSPAGISLYDRGQEDLLCKGILLLCSDTVQFTRTIQVAERLKGQFSLKSNLHVVLLACSAICPPDVPVFADIYCRVAFLVLNIPEPGYNWLLLLIANFLFQEIILKWCCEQFYAGTMSFRPNCISQSKANITPQLRGETIGVYILSQRRCAVAHFLLQSDAIGWCTLEKRKCNHTKLLVMVDLFSISGLLWLIRAREVSKTVFEAVSTIILISNTIILNKKSEIREKTRDGWMDITNFVQFTPKDEQIHRWLNAWWCNDPLVSLSW